MTFRAEGSPDQSPAQSYRADRVDEIVVETAGGSIVLNALETSGVTVAVEPSGAECRVQQSLQGGVLTLGARGPARRSFANDAICAAGFRVDAPAGIRVKAHSIAGSVQVGAFRGSVEVKTGAGDISLKAPVGPLTAHTAAGSISGEASGPSIAASSQKGSVALTGLVGTVTAHSGEGTVTLTWAALPRRGAIEVVTRHGGQSLTVPAGSSARVRTHTDSGTVHSALRDDPQSELSFDLRTTNGPITVRAAEPR